MSRALWLALVLVLTLVLAPQVLAQEAKDLDKILEEVRAHGYLNVPVEHGRFLQLMVELSDAKRVLEVGTSTGYSGLWIARGLRRTGGKLVTIEIDKDRAATARANFKKAGVDDLVTPHHGDAFQVVPKLEGQFDLIFLDAGSFKAFFDAVAPKLRPGGVLLSHNALLLKDDTQKMLDAAKADGRFLTSVVQIGSDGFAVLHKRRPELK